MSAPTLPDSNPGIMSAVEPGRHVFHNYRWIVCALLFFATTINYIDRQILSLLKPILDDEMKWTNEQFGLINSAFQGAYGIGLLAFGWFIDKYGTKVGYAVSIVAWSIAALGHGLVGSVRGSFVDDHGQRRLDGVGEIADMGARALDDFSVGIDQRVGLARQWRDLDREFAF